MLSPLGMPPRNIFAGLMPLREAESMFTRSMERIATGRMINRGSDDPAGLITSQHLAGAIRALETESRSLRREADVLTTREGALAAAGEMVDELEAIAVHAADGTLTDGEREALEIEAASIVRAIEHTAGAASFGATPLFDGALTDELGAVDSDDGDGGTRTHTLADVGRALSLRDDAALVAEIAETAASEIATRRGEIGATIADDLRPRTRAVEGQLLNLTRAHAAIVDTDYAAESARLVRAEMLTRASHYVISLEARNAGLAVELLGAA